MDTTADKKEHGENDDALSVLRPAKPAQLGRTSSAGMAGVCGVSPKARPRSLTCTSSHSMSSQQSQNSQTASTTGSDEGDEPNRAGHGVTLHEQSRRAVRSAAETFSAPVVLPRKQSAPAFFGIVHTEGSLAFPNQSLASRESKLPRGHSLAEAGDFSGSVIAVADTGKTDTGAASMTLCGAPLAVKNLISLCDRHELSLPRTATVAFAPTGPGRALPVGERVTLCGTRENVTAQLVDNGQCISYEPLDSVNSQRTMYEVFRGGLTAGSTISLLWSVDTYSCLRHLILNNPPGRRHVRLAADAIVGDDVEFRRGDELLIACDEVVADATSVTHVPCWRLSRNDQEESFQNEDPWQAVELAMVSLDAAMKLNVCVNSEVLRLRDIRRRSFALPLQMTAYECIQARPEPFAMSGSGEERLRLSTAAKLTLQAYHTHKALVVATDNHAVLLSDTSTAHFQLDERCADLHAACSVLSHFAGMQLSWQQNALLTSLPVGVQDLTEPPSSATSTSVRESIYMDMSGTGYLPEERMGSFSRHYSTSSAEYYSVSLAKARQAVADSNAPQTPHDAPQLPPRPALPNLTTSSSSLSDAPKLPPRRPVNVPPTTTPDGYVDLRNHSSAVEKSAVVASQDASPDSLSGWRPVPLRSTSGNPLFTAQFVTSDMNLKKKLKHSMSEDVPKVLGDRHGERLAVRQRTLGSVSFDDSSLTDNVHANKIYAPSPHPLLRSRVQKPRNFSKRMSRDDLDIELERRHGFRSPLTRGNKVLMELEADGLHIRGQDSAMSNSSQPKVSPRKRTATQLKSLFKQKDKTSKSRGAYEEVKEIKEEEVETRTSRSKTQIPNMVSTNKVSDLRARTETSAAVVETQSGKWQTMDNCGTHVSTDEMPVKAKWQTSNGNPPAPRRRGPPHTTAPKKPTGDPPAAPLKRASAADIQTARKPVDMRPIKRPSAGDLSQQVSSSPVSSSPVSSSPVSSSPVSSPKSDKTKLNGPIRPKPPGRPPPPRLSSQSSQSAAGDADAS